MQKMQKMDNRNAKRCKKAFAFLCPPPPAVSPMGHIHSTGGRKQRTVTIGPREQIFEVLFLRCSTNEKCGIPLDQPPPTSSEPSVGMALCSLSLLFVSGEIVRDHNGLSGLRTNFGNRQGDTVKGQ